MRAQEVEEQAIVLLGESDFCVQDDIRCPAAKVLRIPSISRDDVVKNGHSAVDRHKDESCGLEGKIVSL